MAHRKATWRSRRVSVTAEGWFTALSVIGDAANILDPPKDGSKKQTWIRSTRLLCGLTALKLAFSG